MFDNVGKSTDEEALQRSAIALGIVVGTTGLIAGIVVLYGIVLAFIFVAEEVVGIEIPEEDLVDLFLEEDPELEAPPPPPPPPPPAAADMMDDEEEEEEEIEDVPDEMVEEVAELEEKIEDEVKNAKRPEGKEGGVEGGVEGGEIGGVQGGVIGGVVGGTLGGATAMHHTDVKTRLRTELRYPEQARQMNLGDVSCRVRIFIDEKGKPYDVKFMKCPQPFHASAREGLLKWRWYPARQNGQKVRATFPLNIKYKLRG